MVVGAVGVVPNDQMPRKKLRVMCIKYRVLSTKYRVLTTKRSVFSALHLAARKCVVHIGNYKCESSRPPLTEII